MTVLTYLNNFNEFILNEKLSINNDVLLISKYIFDNIDKSNIILSGKIINTKEIKINDIHITFDKNLKEFGNLNLSKSELTKNCLNLYIKLKYKNEGTIYHEIQHSLNLFFEDKDKILNKLMKLNSLNIPIKLFDNIELKKFIDLVYFSMKYENDAYTTQIYIELLNYFKQLNISNEDEFRQIFKQNIKNNEVYGISEKLYNFSFNDLKKSVGAKNLIIFFNIFEDNFEYYKKNKKDTFWNQIKKVIRDKYILLFNNHYYLNIDKKYNDYDIDKILKKYENEFKNSSKYIKKKLFRLYDLFLDELF